MSRSENLIVSLTTTSYRVQNVHRVIASLLSQTVLPHKIVLWLSKESYLMCQGIDPSNLPSELSKLASENSELFSIRWTQNTGPYRKLLPTVKDWPDYDVLTVDDDVIYNKNMIESMLVLAEKHKNCIVANRCRQCVAGKPYRQWRLMPSGVVTEEKWLLPTGIGGVLYPAGCCKIDEQTENEFMRLAPRCDDVWFRLLTMANGYNVLHTGQNTVTESVTSPANDRALYTENNKKHNDQAFSAVCKFFQLHPNEQHVHDKSVSSFSSKNYWQQRYSNGGSSGAGSYGKLARFKADVLNAFFCDFSEEAPQVIEIGVGDGNQASLLTSCHNYIGVDVSPKAVELAAVRMPHRKFFSYDGTLQSFRRLQLPIADIALSLDVIFHLIEDSSFENYMQTLWSASNRFIVIYSSNVDRIDARHVRHRKWTDWVEKKGATVYRLPQKYPEDSPSDFFFVCKPDACPSFEQLQVSLLQRYTHRQLAADFRRHTQNLIAIVVEECRKNNEQLEGNILFRHQTELNSLTVDSIVDCMRAKRELLYTAVGGCRHGVEIGFNCGFSLLLMMLANHDMSFVVFDLFEHSYAPSCFNYLKSVFSDRLAGCIVGDSCQTVPDFAVTRQNNTADVTCFDFFHIDGGHSYEIAIADLQNCKSIAGRGAKVVVDDFNMPGPQKAWRECVHKNVVAQTGVARKAGSAYCSVHGTYL